MGFRLLVMTPSGVRRATRKDYTEAVRALLLLIPTGKVTSYDDIASLLGLHPRVVSRFLSENKSPPIVPCHRVVGKDGSLRGYSMYRGMATKRRLLELEGVEFDSRDKVLPGSFISLKKMLLE